MEHVVISISALVTAILAVIGAVASFSALRATVQHMREQRKEDLENYSRDKERMERDTNGVGRKLELHIQTCHPRNPRLATGVGISSQPIADDEEKG